MKNDCPLKAGDKIAVLVGDQSAQAYGKGLHALLRASDYDVVCAVGSGADLGRDAAQLAKIPYAKPVPVIGSIEDAIACGATVIVVGIAVAGGQLPDSWCPLLTTAINQGLSLVNGLHTRLVPTYPQLATGQYIWDVRNLPDWLEMRTADGRAVHCGKQRILTIGTDVAVGKKTTAFALYDTALSRSLRAGIVPTGQGGMIVKRRGIPLDAIPLDFAPSAVEQAVAREAADGAEIIFIEGQGALSNPGSNATLALLRGAMPTQLVLCLRARQTQLLSATHLAPPGLHELKDYAVMHEDLAAMGNRFERPKTVAVSLNTELLKSETEIDYEIKQLEDALGLPCFDPVYHGPDALLDAIMTRHHHDLVARTKPFRLM